MRVSRLPAMLLVGVAFLSGCGSPSHTIAGEFTLFAETVGPSSNCSGTGGYSDISQGLSVTVRNEAGTILATSRLGNGSRTSNRCSFTFSVSDIPKSAFYSVEVGRRGELTWSHAEMVEQKWKVQTSLGR